MTKIGVFGDYMGLGMFSECVFSLFSFFLGATFFFLFWIGAPWPQISPRGWDDGTASLPLFLSSFQKYSFAFTAHSHFFHSSPFKPPCELICFISVEVMMSEVRYRGLLCFSFH